MPKCFSASASRKSFYFMIYKNTVFNILQKVQLWSFLLKPIKEKKLILRHSPTVEKVTFWSLPLKMTPTMGSGSPSVFLGIPLADSTTTLNMLPKIASYGCAEDMELTDEVDRAQMHCPAEEEAQNDWERRNNTTHCLHSTTIALFIKDVWMCIQLFITLN